MINIYYFLYVILVWGNFNLGLIKWKLVFFLGKMFGKGLGLLYGVGKYFFFGRWDLVFVWFR